MALALQRNIALAQQRSVLLHLRIKAIDRAAADLRLLVREDGLAVNDVPDPLIAQHFDLGPDPLVTVVGFRSGVDAMGGE